MTTSASFIGLGNMGFPIAANLLKNGVKLFVYNRTKEKADRLVKAGAKLLSSPKEAFAKSPIVFSMLSNDQALHEVCEGKNGLLSKAHTGCIHVSLSTVSPFLSRTLTAKHQENGAHYIACPVFGRPDAAAQQKLWLCVAGNNKAKDQVAELLSFIGQKIYDFGNDPGVANAVKLTGNFMILSVIELLSESYSYAKKSGVPIQMLQSFLIDSLFPSPVFQNYGRMIINQDFKPAGFKMSLGLKDMDLLLRSADFLRVPLPLAGLLHDRLLTGLANMRGDLDWSAISLNAFEDSGLNRANSDKNVLVKVRG
jgi:3-hydroxyisobutyrate dehydrogenase-like beta-hydroxyacid dehydrogenase